MIGDQVLQKTALGLEEIESRSGRLNPKLRMILIMVDGKSTIAELQKKVSSLGQSEEFTHIEKSLKGLVKAGFITGDEGLITSTITKDLDLTVPSNDLLWTSEYANKVKSRLKTIATEVLGDQDGKVVKKIDESSNSKEGLSSALVDCKKIVSLFIDENKADELEQKCHAFLNKA